MDPATLVDTTATELVEQIRKGRRSSRALTAACLERIEQTNHRGPELNAVIAVADDALEVAASRDAAEDRDGVLFGLPVLIKDNIDVAGLPTTAGSLALAEHRPDDAFLVKRLREAGAVLLGKANLSEWANFRSTKSSSGWSAVGGQTRNPHVLDRSPCGSSSGSAVAVAAGLAPLAVGTETDGSILCPAAINGIVGVKPTLGLVSRDGIVPIAHSQDTAGPMARTVADAALLLEVLAAADPDDPATADRPADLDTAYRAALRDDALDGARIGVLRPDEGFEATAVERFEQVLRDLERQGAVLVPVDPVDPEVDAAAQDHELEVLLHEFSGDLAAYLADVEGFATLDDLVAFNLRYSDELRWFGQELFERAAAHDVGHAEYETARETSRRTYADFIDGRVAEHDLQAIVTPSTGPAWPIDPLLGDRFTGGSSHLTAVSGYPAVTVPMGLVEGLPVGVSFIGPAWSEARLLGLAHAYERATRHRAAPAFRTTLTAP